MKTVKELFKGIKYRLVNVKPETAFRRLCSDSRSVKKGDLFIAVKGCQYDGHDYISEALEKGAGAICSERLVPDPRRKGFIIVKDTAKALPDLASRFFDDPSKYLKLIGITGTNGKTTTSYLVYEILKLAGRSPSLLGSVEYKIKDEIVKPLNTTPGPLLLHRLFSQMRKRGSEYAVMEVSSHALKQSRVSGVDFRIAALTNVTGDHLDYHRTMRDYVKSKGLLFKSLKINAAAVLNSDDRFYDEFKKSVKGRVITYGIEKKADFKASRIELDLNGSQFFMDTPEGTINLRTPLVGRHNIYNILAAAAISFTEGIEVNAISEAIGRLNRIPGRLEPVEEGQRFRVFVDYAHTHDALEKVLSLMKGLCNGRVIVVFGCGGNRDKTKRAKMGRIAGRLADYAILTNDNPRKEDPDTILREIEKGMPSDFRAYKKIPDRFKAIGEALANRDPSDIVVLAGKGHEDYQIIGNRKFSFNDKKAAEEILARDTLLCSTQMR
jgi:UDP-N-acetylmuramoyl-L-alanyl-D-glutamate--2,6-diaminopimelate ligase